MTYDVPVKLFSFHLIVLSLFLLAPQSSASCSRAAGAGSPAIALREQPARAQPSGRAARILVAAQIVFGIYVVAMNAVRRAGGLGAVRRRRAEVAALRHLERRSDVDRRPDPIAAAHRLRPMAARDLRPAGRDGLSTHERLRSSSSARRSTRRRERSRPRSPAEVCEERRCVFSAPAPDRLTLDGEMSHHAIHMELRLARSRDSFLLVNRGFHWIQEYPFNR